MRRTDLFGPVDQVSLLILDKASDDDAHLLGPGIALSNLDFRGHFFLPLDEFLFRFPTRELLPVTTVLRV